MSVSIQDRFTKVPMDSTAKFIQGPTIYQDRNLDLPWKESAESIAKAAWPETDFSKSVAILGTEEGGHGFPVKFIQRWDMEES